ncbi:ABC transporter substrate-binding protein [Actinocorallia sp. A-T 12471]|uniref:ABC transporter substrate-binding protein n=1 Tax=Actinocorallia sp. A-T 12471 TaxID=3089813 RepID=UPI0029D02AB3|nr:ABC transporter substrate-binding protein [Actinocorallia sp. A-T 12471]MDX6739662.1 ABC transporter substrate-binding protein [Actinocorallia sp. A-T 12471]
MTRFRLRSGVVGVALLALAASSCASDKAGDGGAGTGADGVKHGPGVTDDTITLGLITDLTGPYAPIGKSLSQAAQLYYDEINLGGGICGRQVETLVRDMSYDAQKTAVAYTELEPKVAALPQFLGSTTIASVRDRLEASGPLTLALAWAPSVLGAKPIQMTGTTYAIDVINGVDHLVKDRGLKKGDKIGHVYLEGDYGDDSVAGSKYAADKLGLSVVEQKVKPTDADMSSQVSALKQAGVKAIILSIAPKQTASFVGVAATAGLKVPVLGSNSAFAPQLLATDAGPAFLGDFAVLQAASPLSADLPIMKTIIAGYSDKFPKDGLDNGVMAGYTSAMVVGDALKKACENKDLSRDGIIAAHRSQNAWDGGFGSTMDFTDPAQPPTRKTYLLKPDPKAAGGLTVQKDNFTSDLAAAYPVTAG